MNFYFRYFALLAVFVLASCSSTVRTISVEASDRVFGHSDSFYVACSNNGMYNGREYPFSASETASAVYNALLRHCDRVEKANGITPRERALAEARSKNFKYLASVQIMQWEDRISSWLGVPDIVEVKISIVDCASGRIIHSAVIAGEGATYSFGNDYPQDLLPEPLAEYFGGVFKKGNP